MTIIYEWQIKKIETKNEEPMKDVISVVHWRLKARDSEDGTEMFVNNCTSLKNPNESDFVALENVSREQITSWIEESMIKRVEHQNQEDPEGEKQIENIDKLLEIKKFLSDSILSKQGKAPLNN